MSDAKISLLDIETTPNLAYVWGMYEQNVIQFETEWSILCFAHKELHKPETHLVSRPDFKKGYKADPDNDFDVCEALWDLLDTSDVIIAHNGDRFDLRKINARLLYHGFSPPSPYQTIDTLKIARRYFAFNSNKLDDLGQTLGLGKKEKHSGFQTWLGCMAGDSEAWREMGLYNIGDVVLLERVYLSLLPWIQGHPNLALLGDEHEGCPSCGSTSMTRQGFKKTKTMTYQQWQCNDCSSWSRTRASEKDQPKPKFIN